MKKIFLTLLVLFFLGAGCNDYLDLIPEKDIETIESIFERRTSASDFLVACYAGITEGMRIGHQPTYPPLTTGGEHTSEYLRYSTNGISPIRALINEGNQNTTSPNYNLWSMSGGAGRSVYSSIRYCNIFIDNIDKVYDMTQSEKDAWKAEVMCVKAYYYLEMMKFYGPIVLIPENMDPNASTAELQLPRSPIDECVEAIVDLVDEAMPNLESMSAKNRSRLGYFSTESALFLKARALMLAASPLFNGNDWYSNFKNRDGEQLVSTEYDNEKWKRAGEAIDAALLACSTMNLHSGETAKNTPMLNTIRDIQMSVYNNNYSLENSEWIFMTKRSLQSDLHNQLPRYNSMSGNLYNSDVSGSLATHIRIVEMYNSVNGVPIEYDKTWPYDDRYLMGEERSPEYTNVVPLNEKVLNLHLRREPRFYAHIAADQTFWEMGNNKYVRMHAYRNAEHGTQLSIIDRQLPQNISGYWIKKNIHPESTPDKNVIMAHSNAPYMIMRLTDLYLMQAEAWNEYSGPSEKVYAAIDVVRERAGILPIRDAWQQFSSDPGKVLSKEGLREEIRRERMIELAFEGHHFFDLRRWKTAHIVLNEPQKGWDVLGEDTRTFYNNEEGPIEVWNKGSFDRRDYLWPIKMEETMTANIVQNPGWAGNF